MDYLDNPYAPITLDYIREIIGESDLNKRNERKEEDIMKEKTILNRFKVEIPTYMIIVDKGLRLEAEKKLIPYYFPTHIMIPDQALYDEIFRIFENECGFHHTMNECLNIEEARIRYLYDLIDEAKIKTKQNKGTILIEKYDEFISFWVEPSKDNVKIKYIIISRDFLNPIKKGKEEGEIAYEYHIDTNNYGGKIVNKLDIHKIEERDEKIQNLDEKLKALEERLKPLENKINNAEN